MNKNIVSRKKMIILLTVITVFFILLEYIILADYFYNVKNNDEHNIKHYEGQYNTIVSSYEKLANAYYDEIISNTTVLELVDVAYTGDELTRKKSRDEIYNLLRPLYDDMKLDNFRQVHFVFPNNISFLRMHKPILYGDDLSDIRETVNIVNETKKFTQGFEEGRIYNGYRYEFPLFNKNRYIGCLEASISFLSVIEAADDLFNTPSFFMMKKAIVDGQVIQSEIENNYIASKISSNYYYDREAFDYIISKMKYNKFIDEALKDKEKIAEVALKLEEHKTFVVHSKFEKNDYSVVFLEINNVVNKHSGYLVFINIDATYGILKVGIILRTILISAIYIIIFSTIWFYRKYKLQIERLRIYDTLTGAYNRKKLYESIDKEINHFNRYGNYFSIIMLDIDHFKEVNDSFGYLNGDSIIKELSDLIFSSIRATDSLYRFGGDEFIVLLSHTDIENALLVAEKLRCIIESNDNYLGFVSDITVSVSVVEYRAGDTLEDLLEKSDVLMRNAKKLGRNRVEYI